MARNSWSSVSNINNWRLWLQKNKCIVNEPDIDKIYLYAKDPNEAKYWLLINKRENTGLKFLNVSKGFIEHANDIDMISNKKLHPIITE